MGTNTKPLIVIATLLHESGPTGVQTHFNALRRYLQSKNQPVSIVTPFHSVGWLVFPIFALRRLIDPFSGAASVWWYRYWHRVFLQWALRREFEKHQDIIVYAQCPLSARAALNARTSSRERVVLVVHFNISQANEWTEKNKIRGDGRFATRIRRLEESTLSALDGIVYVSSFMRQTLCERIPALNAMRSAVIPNWCESNPANDEVIDATDLISIGTLEPRKNQQFLLRVLAEVAGAGKRYTLALIGDGPDRAMLRNLANELGIAQQVRFLGYKKNAAGLLRHARAYVHSANVENLPIALIEALACSKPVFAPPVGGIPDILSDGQQGYFWNTEDCAAAAALLTRVMEDSELLVRLSRQARVRYESEFTAEHAGARLLTFLLATENARRLDSSAVVLHSVNTTAA